mmetsp:Transcript_24402/g.21583  ORF Transcript_24402/g.21583 Transcript_24402/m.21583 type:complete len:183 (+) Transcript_24402:124-672(+)
MLFSNNGEEIGLVKLYLIRRNLVIENSDGLECVHLENLPLLVEVKKKFKNMDLYGFKLILGDFSTFLFATTKRLASNWYEKLGSYCVFGGFEKEYEISKTLFASETEKYLRVKNIANGKRYFARSILYQTKDDQGKIFNVALKELGILSRLSHPKIGHIQKIFDTKESLIIIFQEDARLTLD